MKKHNEEDTIDYVLDLVEERFVQQLIIEWQIVFGLNTNLPSVLNEEWQKVKEDIKTQLKNNNNEKGGKI